MALLQDPIGYYSRLLARQQWLSQALCWTVVEPIGRAVVSVDGVVERLGGDPAAIAERPVATDYELGASPVAHLAQVGPIVMMVEVNGFQGSMRSVLERLSQGARVHSAYWNVNALSALSCAAFGHLLVTFEGLSPDDRSGVDITALDLELDALHALPPPPDGDFRPVIMAIVERRTGIRLQEEWLANAQSTITLPPAPPNEAGATGQWPGAPGWFFDPELESAVRLASPAAQDALAGLLVAEMVAIDGIAAEPEITAALEALRAGAPRGDDRYSALLQFVNRLREEQRTGAVDWDLARRRRLTATAVWLALSPPAHTVEPVHALCSARLALGDDWLPFRTRLRETLRSVG